jgi:RNA polymerase sigma-70 factor (ECF subfamily)
MTAFTDDVLPAGTVSRAREGSAEAREAIFRAFEAPVRTLARRLVPGSAQAEDLAQDVFVDVLTSLGQYEGRGSFAGWVRAVTVRRCLMHLRSPWRRALRWARAADDADAETVLRVEPASGGDAVDLERALARLGDTARAVVWLHDVEGYTHAEIGALLGGTASFSKSQLARAHARLRELLEPEGVKTSCMPVSTNC